MCGSKIAPLPRFILQLAAEDLGLGSCWVQIRYREHDEHQNSESYVRQVAAIPDHLRVDAIIGIGHPNEEKPGHPQQSLKQDRIHWQQYEPKR